MYESIRFIGNKDRNKRMYKTNNKRLAKYLYGQYYNTPKQWYQFEKDFKAGIYDEYLKSA